MDFITIIQGDDTNFLEDQFVVVNFNTSIDLSGFTATFTLGNVTLTYGNLSGKTFEIILSNEITSNLKIGKQYGELKLIDNNNRIRTVSSIIPFIVKKGVDEQITFVNSSLNVTMNINDTVIDIFVETSGISKTEAQRILASCRDSAQAASNYSNTAQNALISVNQTVSAFQQDFSDLSEQLENAQTIYDNSISHIETVTNQKIALATAQADRAETKAEEVYSILENASDSDLTKLSLVGLDKINQTKALETGNVSSDVDIYNKILGYKTSSTKTGIDIIEENYILSDKNVKVKNGITEGLNGSYVTVNKEFTSFRTTLKIHIEAIIGENYSTDNSYFFATNEMGIVIQSQSVNKIYMGFYASDYSIKMLETDAFDINTGDRLIIDGEVDWNNVKISATCNGLTVSKSEPLDTSLWFRTPITGFRYGRYLSSYGTTCFAEIDLAKSYLKIRSEIVRPLFQIPYTLTKTGSKIVDVSNRELVQEIYNKNGCANYYTIDEVNHNFTLPMGEIYGTINKTIETSLINSTSFGTDFIKLVLDALSPDIQNSIEISLCPSSTSPYVTPCAGWYYVLADVTAKRYLYINGIKSPYNIPSNGHSVSVFLAKGDSIYWSDSLSVTYAHAFIPSKGTKYQKPNEGVYDNLEDLFS